MSSFLPSSSTCSRNKRIYPLCFTSRELNSGRHNRRHAHISCSLQFSGMLTVHESKPKGENRVLLNPIDILPQCNNTTHGKQMEFCILRVPKMFVILKKCSFFLNCHWQGHTVLNVLLPATFHYHISFFQADDYVSYNIDNTRLSSFVHQVRLCQNPCYEETGLEKPTVQGHLKSRTVKTMKQSSQW